MRKKTFDYKPLACNKNDRQFKSDIRKAIDQNLMPLDSLYVRLGDINDNIVRYVVIALDENEELEGVEDFDVRSVKELLSDA